MTTKDKTLFKKIGYPVLAILVSSLVLWLVTSSIGEMKTYGRIRETPKRLDKLENCQKKNAEKVDSIGNLFIIHNGVQVEQLIKLNENIVEIKNSIALLYELQARRGN